MTVVREDPAARSVLLSGTIAQFQGAFGVKLEHYQHRTAGEFRGRTGPVNVPDDLHGVVEAVLGLDNRPRRGRTFASGRRSGRRRRIRFPSPLRNSRRSTSSRRATAAGNASASSNSAADTPAAISMRTSRTGVASPTVKPVSVDQARNEPTGDPNGPDGEVTLDIEVVGAIAPGATIAVYFTPNSDAGFIDALSRAVHDTANKPSVISISWGAPESSWTSQSLQAFNSVLETAAALGVTVCAASGDSGSSDGVNGGDQVDFPASSPYVLACGGTSLTASGTSISREVVWNDGAQGGAGGGGVSRAFPVPAWQRACPPLCRAAARRPSAGAACPTWPATHRPSPATRC